MRDCAMWIAGVVAVVRVCSGCTGEVAPGTESATDASKSGTSVPEAAADVLGQVDARAVAADADFGPTDLDAQLVDARTVKANIDAAADIGIADSATEAMDAPTRTLGDQCNDVLSEYCKQLARCAISVTLAQCISNDVPLCCAGSACTTSSTVSEATVASCEQRFDALDCTAIVNTANPAACLFSP